MSNGNPWLTSVSSPPILPFDAGPTAHLALPSTVGPPKLPLVELVRFSRLRSSCVDYLSIIYVWKWRWYDWHARWGARSWEKIYNGGKSVKKKIGRRNWKIFCQDIVKYFSWTDIFWLCLFTKLKLRISRIKQLKEKSNCSDTASDWFNNKITNKISVNFTTVYYYEIRKFQNVFFLSSSYLRLFQPNFPSALYPSRTHDDTSIAQF